MYIVLYSDILLLKEVHAMEEKKLKTTEAHRKANIKWQKENYSRIPLDVPKEYHIYLKARAQADGQTLGAWIKQAIEARAQNVSEEIPPEVFKNLKEWLLNHGHTIEEYLDCIQYIGKENN